MRVLICGDRHWEDESLIRKFIEKFPIDTVVIEGEADGADKISRKVAEEFSLKVIPRRAKWEEYGLSAGPIRNRVMLDDKPDFVIGFHDNIDKSKGTINMLNLAKKRGIPNFLITHNLTSEEVDFIINNVVIK